MKRYSLLILAAAFGAMTVLAQDTNLPIQAPPPSPSPAATAPPTAAPPEAVPGAVEKKEFARPKPHRPKRKNQVMVYDTPMAAVVKDEVVNVRGRPSFVGSVIGHLKKGDTVTVYETITLGSHEKDEPAKWDRIDMPTNHLVWLDALFVNSNKEVRSRKLNLRDGPGENYDVVGQLEKGAPIDEVRREKGWIGIEPPTNSYAYVAAECLTIQGPAAVMAMNSPPPAPTAVQVPAEPPAPVAAAPTPTPVPTQPPPAPPQPQTPPPQEQPQQAAPPPVAPAPTAASQTDQELNALRSAEAQPQPTVAAAAAGLSADSAAPRIVTREGFVHRAFNIQAPADYELRDIKTGDLIDFLQPPKGKNFKIYVGTRVTVTGAEFVDPRWVRTPVLQIQSVDLLP